MRAEEEVRHITSTRKATMGSTFIALVFNSTRLHVPTVPEKLGRGIIRGIR